MQYLADLFTVISRALRLDPNAMAGMEAGYGPWAIPIGILVVVTISTLIGEAIVLVINQVRSFRLVLTLALSVIAHLLTYFVLGAVVWVAGSLILGTALHLQTLVQSVMVSAAPYVLGFLVLLPYSGPGVERFIQLWSFASLWAIVMYEFSTDRWTALLITAIGFLGMVVANRTIGRPLSWLRDRLWRFVTGEPMLLSAQEIRDSFEMPPAEPPAGKQAQ
ncbi:MAG TPA: hypothetical protein VFC82_05255 [Actinomycetaceae bacterium]|nr:hypothetical protein [Actinomycetaceae bacterium]